MAYVPIQPQTPVSFSFGAAGVEAFSFSAGGPILTAILDPSRVFPSYRLTALASSGESYEFTSSGGIAVKAVRGSIVKVTIALFYAPASGNNYIAGGFNALRAVRGSNLVTVPGGTLPQGSGLAGQVIRDFQIGKTEVTWAEWQEVRDWAISNGYTDLAGIGGGSGPDHPVRDVNWYDVAKWCNAASEAKGLVPAYRADGAVFRTGETGTNETSEVTVMAGANGFRLPTEAEWEWAARGGANSKGYIYSGSNDLDAVAWYRSNSLGAVVPLTPLGRGTRPVGSKAANELGLHDMNGNTWEWCWDTDTTNRLIRGGSFVNNPFECDVGFRGYLVTPTASGQWRDLGFRVAKTFTQASLEQIGSIEPGVFGLSSVDFADRLAFDRGTLIAYQYGGGGGWPLTDGGKVHVFTTTNTVSAAGPWAYRQTLNSPDAVYDWPSFGMSLGVSSNTVFVGANTTYRVGAHDGTGYIFTRSSEGSNFAFIERWSEIPSQWAGYFSSVAALRNGLLILSQGANASYGSYGGAYFYSLGGNGTRSKIHSFLEGSFDKWVAASAIATNTASVFMASSSTNHEIRIFGISRNSSGVPTAITTNQVLTPLVGVDTRPSQSGAMDMTEDLLAVGRSLFTTNGITNCGAVDVYRKGTNGLFSLSTTIAPPEPWNFGQFGHSVLLVGRTLVIASPGAPKAESNAVGALYLYDIAADGSASLASTPRLQQSASYTNEVFASSLARDSDTIAVGTTGNTGMSESPSRPELKSTGISGRILLYQVASGALGTNSPPQIASTNSFTGTVGVSFSNTVTATGSTPITFGASNLPAGLTISTNGVITGTPTAAGTNVATLTASNAYGVTNQPATFVIGKGTPVISNWPTASPIFFGQSLSNSVLSGGSANVAGSFAWTAPTNLPPVGTNSYSVTFTPGASNDYAVLSSAVPLVVGSAQNLVSNGGFESPSYPIGSHYHPPIGALGAWQTTDSQFEVWANPPLVVPAIEGTQHLEVDASAFQSIAAVPNQLYKLSFWHSARPGFDNVLNVSVDSLILRTFQENGASASAFVWKKFTIFFVARGPQATIGFTNTHLTLAGNGSHIDDVRVEAVVDTDGDGLSDDYERGYDRYEVVEGAFTWEQARMDAEIRGGHLATITSEDEKSTMLAVLGQRFLQNGSYHLGATDEQSEGQWRWVTGENWGFTDWAPLPTAPYREPNGGIGENYLEIFAAVNPPWDPQGAATKFRWNDASASHLGPYILEFGYPTDPFKADTDGDGYNDKVESDAGTDPNNASAYPAPPQITSTNSYPGTVGVSLSNTVTASGSTPITFGASNLPAGLSISTNGVITGTPNAAGTNVATLTASNAYGVTNQSTTFVIGKGTPVVSSWPTASSIIYGQALSSSVFSGGSASAAGSFIWNAPSTVLNAGTNLAAVTFRPDSTNNYNTVSTNIAVVVSRAAPNVTSWPVASSITYGQALSNSVLSGGVAGVDGSFTFVSPSTTPPVGLSTHAVRFAPTDSANYSVSTNTVTVTVNKASPVVITLPSASAVTEGQSLGSSMLSGGSANVPGTFAWAEPGTVFASVGAYSCPVIFTPNDTANYVPVTVQVSVNATALPTYSLSVVSSAGGTVNASPSAPYKQGTAVTLTPVPESGFVFVRWAGGATGSANPLTLTMTSNVSLQAIFSQAEPADSNPQEFVAGSRLGAGATASTAGGANAVAATPDGGTVSVGDFTGSLTILGQTYNAGVNNRGYVLKHNAQGVAQWIAVTGASGTTVKNERVAVDAAGNVFVAGTFTGTVNFGPSALTAKGNADVFVMKLSSAGVVQWVVSGGGTSAETLNGIFAGADGEVYVTGGFFGASATFGALPLAAAGSGSSNRDAFLGRVSAAGAWEWVTAAGGSLADQGRALTAAGTGGLWWGGNFQGSAAVGSNQLTSQGATDVFFAQVDAATGAITSSFRTGGTGEDAIMALLSDRAEGFYAAGSFSSSVSFGSMALASSGVGDGYVARWQKNVQWTWAVPLQGGDDDLVTSLALDAEGRLYAGGYFASESLAAGSSTVNNSSIFSYEGFVARFTSTGTVKWLRGIQGDNSEYVRGVACVASGALHAVGYTESALTADLVSLTAPVGLGDAFFLHMNPASTAPSRTVTVTASRGGSVTLSPAGPSYPMGTQVTLTAVPEAGFGFTGWSGDASGTTDPLTVTVNQSLTINANFADTGAPAIVVTSPVNGSQAAKATVNFAGRITDNTAVSSATWALNGVDKGNLSLAQDGSFTVSNVPLVLGDNIFTVTAADAVGNEAVNETSVVWSPVRTFSLPTTATISEGRLLKIPLRLNSEGNVGGLQVRLTFDPAVFTAADFEFRGAAALGFTAKNSIEGRLDLATSLGGSAIPSGIQTIGELSLRARSVPLSGVTSPINVEVVSVSDNTGSILPDGTGTSGCAVAVKARSLPADINGNGFIDSGDGSVMMSLVLSQDPVARPWDVTLNDLNNSETLDPGDVTRLLRIVVGLDPKPSAFVVPRTMRAMSMRTVSTMSAMSMSAASAQQAESYYLHEQSGKVPVTVQVTGHLDGETITADVVLPAMGNSLNSLQFELVYPTDLLEVSEITKGVVAPFNAQFNNVPASSRVIFGAFDNNAWASAGGSVLRVTFSRKPGVLAGAARRLITLENLAAFTDRQGGSDPLEVFQRPGVLGRPMASVLTESVGAEPNPTADTDGDGMSNAAEYSAGTDPVDRASRFEVKGFAHNPAAGAQTITWRANRGVRYRMQTSEDLTNWSAVNGMELIGDDTDVTMQVTPVGTKTKLFYRLQVVP